MATDFDRDDRLHGLLRDALRRQPASGPCIDAATLAAWADATLTTEETAAIDIHLATCSRCRELAAALSMMPEAETTPAATVVPFTPRPNGRWKVVAGAMGAVAASVLIWVAVRDGAPSLETTSADIRAQQSEARGMGGSVPAPAPVLPALTAEESSALQQRADALRDAQRLQGQQGQQESSAARSEAKVARENAARALEPSPKRVSPSPAPVQPPARQAAPRSAAAATAAEQSAALRRTLPPPPASPPPPAPAMPVQSPVPVAGPPPPAAAGGARSSTVTGLPQSTINIDLTGIKPADPRQASETFFTPPAIIAEFVAGADLQLAQERALGAVADRSSAGGAGRGGGARGGGGGAAVAGAAGGAAAQKPSGGFLATEPVRWRLRGASSDQVTPSMAALERSNDGGATWQQVPIPVLTMPLLTGGTAPTNSVCWLVGRTGIVLLSTDGTTFRQVTKPVEADLVSVRATDARAATVRTADGRTFATTDGGLTWTK